MNIRPTVVLAVDAARARLFRIDGTSPRGFASLVELVSLARPEARIPESQRYSDSNPHSAIGGRGHQTFDDHREEHEHEERRRFAKMIAAALIDTVPAKCRAVICVTHSMYAALKDAFERHCPNVDTTWHARECTLLSPHELSVMLTELHLLAEHGVFSAESEGRKRTA
jgi:Protein required for attachment to host cells